MKPIHQSLVIAVALCPATLITPALAEQPVATSVAYQESGAQERVALSGKLRMLSQRIPSAACHLAAGIDADISKALLADGVAEFDTILNALEVGDTSLNIVGAERRAKTVAKIKDLKTVWAPLKAAAENVIAGDMSDEYLQVILDQNTAILDSAKQLVVELSGQYSNPFEMVQSDAFLIDIAGRQRMLTQQMAKDSCVLATGRGTPETAKALEGSIRVFGSSLEALRHGLPGAGISKPPTAAIAAGLEEVADAWAEAKPALLAGLEGAEFDAEREAQKFRRLNATMSIMNDVVVMYTKAAKRES